MVALTRQVDGEHDGHGNARDGEAGDGKAGAPFFAEVDALPKPARGRRSKRAGAAELYNWGVPADRRLAVGMRLTGIDDAHVAGWPYAQVVAALKHAGRPVRLRFADVSKGTRACGSDEDEDGSDDSDRRSDGTATSGDDLEAPGGDASQLGGKRLSRLYQRRVDELARALVTRELHVERWRLARRQGERALAMTAAKSLVLAQAVDALETDQRGLRAASDALARDRRRLERVLSDLKAQAAPGAVRPEVQRAQRLEERQGLLLRDILRLEQGNERLKRERSTRRQVLEDAERELVRAEAELDKRGAESSRKARRLPSQQLEDEDEDEDEPADEAAEWLGDDAAGLSAAETLAALRVKTRAVEEELAREQRKLAKARHERSQLRKLDDEFTARSNGERML